MVLFGVSDRHRQRKQTLIYLQDFFPRVLISGADAAREMAIRHLLLVVGISGIIGDDGVDAA